VRDALVGAAVSLALALLSYVARCGAVLVGKVRALEQFLHGYGDEPGLLKQLRAQLAEKNGQLEKFARDLDNAFSRVRALEQAMRAGGLELPEPTKERE
jgi:cell division protein FtsB